MHMLKNIGVVATALSLLIGSATAAAAHPVNRSLSQDDCRKYPGKILNGFEFIYRISKGEAVIKQASEATLVGETPEVNFTSIDKVPFVARSEAAIKSGELSSDSMILDTVDTGVRLAVSVENNERYTFDFNHAYLKEITRQGDRHSFIESPVVLNTNRHGQALINEKVSFRYATEEPTFMDELFGLDSREQEGFRFEMIACPIYGAAEGSVKRK